MRYSLFWDVTLRLLVVSDVLGEPVSPTFKVQAALEDVYYDFSSSSTGFYNPLAGFSLLSLEVSRSHTMTRHSR